MEKKQTKSKLTLDEYTKLGAKVRLLTTLGNDVWVDVGHLLKASDLQRLRRALSMLDSISNSLVVDWFNNRSKLTENTDFPTYDYEKVFWGDTNNLCGGTPVDTYMHKLIKETAESLLQNE